MNAKAELLAHIKSRNVLCALVTYNNWKTNEQNTWVLPVMFTTEDWATFLNALDFDYNNDYGTQYLYGTIWYKDGTWSSRAEYDGSEWWNHVERPSMPEECFPSPQEKKKVRYIYQLPPDLQEKAINNTIKLSETYRTRDSAMSLLLSEAFSWDRSPEGHKFWENLWEGWL